MTNNVTAKHRDLLPLFPRFLMARRTKWKGLQEILQSKQLGRPAFFLLMALVQETNPGETLSRQEMESRLFNPYATYNAVFDNLPFLLEQGYLSDSHGRYLVTAEGRTLIEQTEEAARDYVATLTPLPLPELTHLANLLKEIAQRRWQADEPTIKAHQARCQRLPLLATASPMVHLEAAIFALWMARDDAYMATWRAKGLSGPQVDLLSRLQVGEVQTLSALTSALQQTQHPEDIVQGITALHAAGYVHIEGERNRLTETGRQVRAWIEEETDRVYFTAWPPLTSEELDWMYSSLAVVCDKLSTLSGV